LADIFVSYSRQDKVRVVPLVASLEAEGWCVWWDPDITPGEEFDSLISRELEGARSLVVDWTPTSVDSRWVRGEARDAADRGVLVPVRFDNAKLPIDFRALHTTDLDQWGQDAQGAAFRSLCKALETKLGAPTKPAHAQAAQNKKAEVSICVLPFANMSGDPEQEYFSDGITEDIITDLGKVSALSIVSRNMAFSFKEPRAARARSGKRPRRPMCWSAASGAAARLASRRSSSTRPARHVWGERYDCDLSDIFAPQDENLRPSSPRGSSRCCQKRSARSNNAPPPTSAYKFT
jgi:adenylate cyclase